MLDIINVLECFAPVFSARVWRNAKIMLMDAILCRKEHTVAAILRVMGLGNVTLKPSSTRIRILHLSR